MIRTTVRPPQPVTPPDEAPLSVLLVDFEPAMCRWVGRMLHRLGHRVETTHTRRDAEERFNHRHHDIVLTDSRLPDGSGLELGRMLRQRHPTTPIVVMADYNVRTAAPEIRDGMPRLKKPFKLAELERVLRHATILRTNTVH